MRPTSVERETLGISSLPFEWRRMTSFVPRRRPSAGYLDAVSMLLELALLSRLDVPLTREHRDRPRSGSTLVVGAGATHGAALDGALVRLRAFEERDPVIAAVRLAPYVAALEVAADGAEAGRARARGLTLVDEAGDTRTALLVWMLKLDYSLGRGMCDELFPRPGRRAALRALRRARPSVLGHGDDEAAAAAYRVLYAVSMAPTVWGGTPG